MSKKKFFLVLVLIVIFNYSIVGTLGQNPNEPNAKQTQNSQLSANDSANAIAFLRGEINNIISDKSLKNTNFGISVYSLNNKKNIYNRNDSFPLTPASTTKLFTTFTALSILGKDFHLKTSAYYDGSISNGVLNGNIYIVGRGDALFSINDIENLCDEIKNQGINRITGKIYADGSYFDNITNRMYYSGDRDEVEPTQPITALALEKNIATVLITAGANSRGRAHVQVLPSSESFKIVNNTSIISSTNTVKTVKPVIKKGIPQKTKLKANPKIKQKAITTTKIKKKSRSRACLYKIDNYSNSYECFKTSGYGGKPIKKKIKAAKVVTPPQGITVTSKLNENNEQVFYVSGNLRNNTTNSYRAFILRPDLAVAGAFKERLRAGGIVVDGSIGIKTLKESQSQTHLLAETYHSLDEMIYLLMKASDNYLAENVFKLVCSNSGYNNISADAGKKKIIEVMAKNNIDFSNCQINDGSGLSRRNRISPKAMSQLLMVLDKHSFKDVIFNSLPVAGVDGTLIRRMINTPAANNLHAKTGTHGNVSALGGYVKTLDGDVLVFSFIFNGGGVGYYKKAENDLGVILSEFSYNKNLINRK